MFAPCSWGAGRSFRGKETFLSFHLLLTMVKLFPFPSRNKIKILNPGHVLVLPKRKHWNQDPYYNSIFLAWSGPQTNLNYMEPYRPCMWNKEMLFWYRCVTSNKWWLLMKIDLLKYDGRIGLKDPICKTGIDWIEK